MSAKITAEVPEILRHASATAVACLDRQGQLLDANKGFMILAHREKQSETGWNAADVFIQPSFQDISNLCSATDEQIVYQGILNIGNPAVSCRSVNGSILQIDDRLMLVAEHDINDLENLAATVVQLNDEMAQMQRELVKANRELKRNETKITRLMRTAPLTGAANRRYLEEIAEQELKRCKRYSKPLCLVMGDIDHFKSVNDNYGHDVGDIVIRAFADTLKNTLRESDFFARVGGEEFVILLLETELNEAQLIMDRIRLLFASNEYAMIDRHITASFGLTQLRNEDTLQTMIKRADLALYQAKEQGRNRVICYQDMNSEEKSDTSASMGNQ